MRYGALARPRVPPRVLQLAFERFQALGEVVIERCRFFRTPATVFSVAVSRPHGLRCVALAFERGLWSPPSASSVFSRSTSTRVENYLDERKLEVFPGVGSSVYRASSTCVETFSIRGACASVLLPRAFRLAFERFPSPPVKPKSFGPPPLA